MHSEKPPKNPEPYLRPLLGGSWVVISRLKSRVTILITHIRGLISPLIATHEPPSTFDHNSLISGLPSAWSRILRPQPQTHPQGFGLLGITDFGIRLPGATV